MHLLDDGFQHRQLVRTVDVVLVTEQDLDDALLPAGNRREPLRALRRADAVVLREEERGRVEQRIRRFLRKDAAVWSVRREMRFAEPLSVSTVAFCGIARPEGFFAMLAKSGCMVAGRTAFADHHAYTAADVEQLVSLAKACGATGFVTTEKDMVKLSGAMLERLRSAGPVAVAALDARFVDEAGVLRGIEERLR